MRKLLFHVVVVGLISVLSIPALAQETAIEDRVKALEDIVGSYSFYGSVRFQTFYNDTSNIDANTRKDVGIKDDEGLRWDLAGNARFGTKVTRDKISGVYEIGLDDDASVYTRLIYATYDFGAGTVLFGQDYTPISRISYSNQVFGDDLTLTGWGAAYEPRTPQIRFEFKGLEIAFVKDKGSSIPSSPSAAGGIETQGDVDVLMPKIEMRYHVGQENIFADVFGGFFAFEVEDVVALDNVGDTVGNYGDETVNSWIVGAGGGVNLDPVFIRAQAYYARNAADFNLTHTNSDGAKFDAAGDIVDEDNFGAHFVAGATLGKYTVEAGIGYVSSEYDESGSEADNAMSYYLNAMIPIYGPFFVVPEIGVLDYLDGEDGEDEDKDITYVGAKWQVNF